MLALIGALIVLWLSGQAPREAGEFAFVPAAGSPAPAGTPASAATPGWAPAAVGPLAATAGPQRLLNGDWKLPDPRVDRTLIKAPAEEPVAKAPEREAHVIPQAPLLRLVGGLGMTPASSRSSAPVEPPKAVAAAPTPIVSTPTARAALPPPPPAPRRKRTLIPIPEPANYGLREARSAKPVFKSEFPIPPSIALQAQPNAIAIDPNLAVLLIDRKGDGYLTPVAPPSAKNAGTAVVAASVSSSTARSSPPPTRR